MIPALRVPLKQKQHKLERNLNEHSYLKSYATCDNTRAIKHTFSYSKAAMWTLALNS